MEEAGRVLDEPAGLVARLQRHLGHRPAGGVDEIDLVALRIARRDRGPVGEGQQRPAGERRYRHRRLRDRRRELRLEAAAHDDRR